MHFSFWEKLGFGVLVAAWVAFGANFVGNALIHAEPLEKSAYLVELPDGDDASATETADVVAENAVMMLASADLGRGEKVFGKCKSCHTVDDGGKNKIGPNLWNIVGGAKAAVAGFSYSKALTGMEGDWSYENLDKFLTKPKDYVPGTKMNFVGLKKASDRAAILLYLRAQSASPKPLP